MERTESDRNPALFNVLSSNLTTFEETSISTHSHSMHFCYRKTSLESPDKIPKN